MSYVTAAVYDPDGTFVDLLRQPTDWQWVDAESEPGVGQVSVLIADVTDDVVDQGNVIRFSLNDAEVFAVLVDPPSSKTLVSPDERTVTLAGRGVGALLAGCTVLPETGLGRAPRERPFNWTSRHFVAWGDVTWASPATHGTVAAPANTEWEKLEGWPTIATSAEWMQAGAPTGGAAPGYIYPPIRSYYRRQITIPSAMDVGFYVTGDDEVDLWVDGELLVRTQGTMQWQRTHLPDQGMHYDAGHVVQIAIAANNLARPGGAHAPDSAAGVVFAACELNSSGVPTSVLAISQGTGWTAVGDPPHPPGMTPGRKLRLLVDEAKARGCIPGVTMDFNDEFATARPSQPTGEEWLDNVDSRVEHGRTVLDVISAESATTVDWHMAPDLELRMWGRGRRYEDLSLGDAPVMLEPGRDILTMTAGPGRHRTNALHVETAEGFYVEVTDTSSITAHGRSEGFRRLGEQAVPDSAQGPAEQIVADSADPAPVANIEFSPDAQFEPYIDFQVGDWIKAPGMDTTWAKWRVIVIRCRSASDFRPAWTVTAELVEAL